MANKRDRSQTKGERRENKKRGRGKMGVSGRSIFLLRELEIARNRKQAEGG